jgi:hypothetical protein
MRLAMSRSARLASSLLLACAWTAAGSPLFATGPWMTETAMRTAFIGKTLDGYYADGEDWTERYDADGRLDYSDRRRRSPGSWYFRGEVFCTFYDPGRNVTGGCFTAIQAGTKCYEFYLAEFSEREADKEVPPGPVGRWVARASRRGEPSTCEARPTV